jgi:hypothetical protein
MRLTLILYDSFELIIKRGTMVTIEIFSNTDVPRSINTPKSQAFARASLVLSLASLIEIFSPAPPIK